LLFCNKYAASVDPSVNPSCNRSSCLVISWLNYGSAMLAGLLACQLDRLERLECCGVSDLQIQIIWPRDAAAAIPSLVPYRTRTHYVSAGGFGILLSKWTCTTVPCWWPSPGDGGRVRSAATAALIIPATARSTIGDCAFSLAATRAWNSLPHSVMSSASLPVFRMHLKTVLFTRSFPS